MDTGGGGATAASETVRESVRAFVKVIKVTRYSSEKVRRRGKEMWAGEEVRTDERK